MRVFLLAVSLVAMGCKRPPRAPPTPPVPPMYAPGFEPSAPARSDLDVVTALHAPGAIVADAKRICWAESHRDTESGAGRIACMPASGGPPFTVAQLPGRNFDVVLALDGDALTWTAPELDKPGAIWRALLSPAAAGAPQPLASGLDSPTGLAASRGELFWLQRGRPAPSVWRLGGRGTAPEQLALPGLDAQEFDATSLAVDADRVLVGGRTGVVAIPRTGGAPSWIVRGTQVSGVAAGPGVVAWSVNGGRPKAGSVWVATRDGRVAQLASGQTYPDHLAIAGGFVFWEDAYAHTLLRAPAKGGRAEVVASNQFVRGIATAGRKVLWTSWAGGELGAVRGTSIDATGAPLAPPTSAVCPDGEPCARTIAERGDISSIAALGDFVYWAEDTTGTIWRASARGGPPALLFSGQSRPTSLAIGNGKLFWANRGSGEVESGPLGGGAARTLAQGEKDVHALRVDGDELIWASGGEGRHGTIARMQNEAARGPSVRIASTGSALDLAVDGDWIYWSRPSTDSAVVADDVVANLFRVKRDGSGLKALVGRRSGGDVHVMSVHYDPGGTPLAFADAGSAEAIAVRGHQLFWERADSRDLDELDLTTGRMQKLVGPEVARSQSDGWRLAGPAVIIVGDRVIWTAAGGSPSAPAIYSARLDGSDVRRVVAEPAMHLAFAGGVLFFSNRTGKLSAIELP